MFPSATTWRSIKIANADDLPVLTWQESDPTVGQEVYAAGFPLGDPEFTMTRGIVAKAQAAGDTPWASIDYTLEHDANIQPGNSGGPLIATDGKVVAVNYATSSATNTSQFFAIDSALAQDVVEQLQDGDFESLGINGSAVVDEEAGITGVWVSGVAPGSPVSEAGVLPGDIVTALNGLPLGADGTMKDYCDVLRTARPGTPIQIEVLRYDTQEVLRGELYGDTPIEPVFSFAEEVGDVDTATAETYSGYQTLVDDTGKITIDVPNEWTDVITSPLVFDDGTENAFIQASTDNEAFDNTWDVPGLFYAALAPTDRHPRNDRTRRTGRRSVHDRQRRHRLRRRRVHRSVPVLVRVWRQWRRVRRPRGQSGRRLLHRGDRRADPLGCRLGGARQGVRHLQRGHRLTPSRPDDPARLARTGAVSSLGRSVCRAT